MDGRGKKRDPNLWFNFLKPCGWWLEWLRLAWGGPGQGEAFLGCVCSDGAALCSTAAPCRLGGKELSATNAVWSRGPSWEGCFQS